jgi:hypothetical protein
MRYDPKIHHRRSIRLKGYDYSSPGAYYVTLCSFGKQCVFGGVVNDQMQENEFAGWRTAELCVLLSCPVCCTAEPCLVDVHRMWAPAMQQATRSLRF